MSRRNIVRAIVLVAAVLTLGWLAWFVDAVSVLRAALVKVQALGSWAPFWFILIYIVGCLTMFPGIILTLGGGVLFGQLKGTLFVSVGATIGAVIAFLISRYLARAWVERKWGRSARFQAIDQAVAEEGWKIVGLMRLSPVVPFTPMNFIFGLTRIPLVQFIIVTWISILPLTALFVYVGTLIGDLTQLGTRPVASGQLKWFITAIGLVSTVIVTFMVTRMAKRSLAAKMEDAST